MTTDASPFQNWSATPSWTPWIQAPDKLVQPILPWTFNINCNNSTAPQTEADVIAKHSYGRQIGRISDALRALVLEAHPRLPKTGPFAEFIAMWDDIEKVKIESATARVEQIASDLGLLKVRNPAEYLRLRDALRQALKQTE